MTTTPVNTTGSPALSRGDWTVDPAQSTLGFRTRALGLFTVKGSCRSFSGALHVDPCGAVTGELDVEAATIATGINRRDMHLRSKDFFHASTYPRMTFDLNALEVAADGTARLTGTLHIRDRDLQIDTPVTLDTGRARGLRLDARFEIDHRAAGFESTRLPRHVQIEASITLEPAG